jgi:general secretion pathway protein D
VKGLRILKYFNQPLVAILALVALTGTGCTAARVFRQATHEEARDHWDLAVMAYQKALALDPENNRYKLSLFRAKMKAAQAHYQRGKLHRQAGQLDIAALEFEQSVALDATNDVAQQDWKRTLAEIEQRKVENAGGTAVERAKAKTKGARATPPMLNPSSTKPINASFPQETPIKKIYQFLATAAGINIIYDPQLKDDKFSIDLRDMTFQKALETAMRQAGHFYKVIDEKTILIAQDTNQNRKEYEDLVIRTFFLSNGDVKDVSAMVRNILDLRRIAAVPQLNAIVIRDTADKVSVAEKIIEINDKAKAEVVVDVELLQLNTTKAIELGTKLSSYSTTATLTGPTVGAGGSGTVTGPIATLPWSDIFKIGLSDFAFAIPTVSFNFIKNNSDAEVLAKPQLRIAEGEKAQLTIGDRVPIPVTTVNTSQTVGGTGVIPITSFQYQDVGIKIDLEPRVHHNKEVTLKLTIEVSNLNGKVSGPNGQDQPIIGTRTITSTIRLKDGETNILAGLIRSDSTKTKTTLPFLGDIPLLGALFSNTRDESSRTDLLLTLTPHIIRAPQITEEDLLPIWVGTENNVSFSGLNTRLESPNAPGSPFDTGDSRPLKSVAPAPAGGRPTSPGTQNFPQGGGPNDPFKRDVPSPVPTPKPRSAAPGSGGTGAPTPESSNLSAPGPALSLSTAVAEIAANDTTVVTLQGRAGLADTGAMELTVEWDPAVAEVTGIAAGPWRDGPDGQSVRFEADRTPGHARLQFSRPVGSVGLPDGVLANFQVRGVAPGTTLFRVSAGAASGKSGGARPVTETASLTVRR